MNTILTNLDEELAPSAETDPLLVSGQLDADTFLHHPVVVQNREKLHYSRIRPVSLFCDSAQYTKRDSFFGFYMRDMRTSREFVSFIVSTLAMYSDCVGISVRTCVSSSYFLVFHVRADTQLFFPVAPELSHLSPSLLKHQSKPHNFDAIFGLCKFCGVAC